MPFAGLCCTGAAREPMPKGRTDLYEPVSAKPTRRHTCAADFRQVDAVSMPSLSMRYLRIRRVVPSISAARVWLKSVCWRASAMISR